MHQLPPDSDALKTLLGEEKSLDLERLLGGIRQRWPWILVVALVTVLGAWLQYLRTPKEYQATATLQIDRPTVSIGGMQWYDSWYDYEYYPTQYKLLQSRGLAEKVVQDLRLAEDPVFNPGTDTATGTGRLASRLQAGLTVEPIENTQLVEISFRSTAPEIAARIANGVAEGFGEWLHESRVARAGDKTSYLNQQMAALKGDIEARQAELEEYGRRTDIVAVEPSSNVTMRRFEALNRDYVAAVSDRIVAEARLADLTGAPSRAVAGRLDDASLAAATQNLRQLEEKYAAERRIYRADWPAMRELEAEIEAGRQRLDELVSTLSAAARERAEAALEQARNRESRLAAALDQSKQEVLELNSKAVGYDNLRMEVETRRQLLEELTRRQSETELEMRDNEATESKVRVVERALVPGSATYPSLSLYLRNGSLVGLLLGFLLVAGLELLDRTIKTGQELEGLGHRVLGVVPDIAASQFARLESPYSARRASPLTSLRHLVRTRSDSRPAKIELLPHHEPFHAISETYRSLANTLRDVGPRHLSTLAITSARAGEGKSSTAANLGVAMTQLGERVLLLDLDLRKPRLHKIFRVSNRVGIAHYLQSRIALEEVLLRTEVPELDVIPGGSTLQSPWQLLSSKRISELLEAVSVEYDIVILDTPPLLAVTDPTQIASRADGTLICLEAGVSQGRELEACTERLDRSGANLLGVVLNRYRLSRREYGKYYYYYDAYNQKTAARHTAGADRKR